MNDMQPLHQLRAYWEKLFTEYRHDPLRVKVTFEDWLISQLRKAQEDSARPLFVAFYGDGFECSSLIGVFSSQEKAQGVADQYLKEQRSWRTKESDFPAYDYVSVEPITIDAARQKEPQG